MSADGQDEYLKALRDKLAAQESVRVDVSREVREFIGDAATGRWVKCVWPVRCQTCSDPIGTTGDLSADGEPGGDVLLSLHHSVCRPSGVRPPGQPMLPPASAVIADLIDVGAVPGVPVMVVNPSCEQLLLARIPGGWRNATLDGFAELGFTLGLPHPMPRVRSIEARLEGDRLTVVVTAGRPASAREWELAATGRDELPELRARVTSLGGIAVAVTSSALPGTRKFNMQETLSSPDSLTGWVPLASSPGRGWPSVRPGRPGPQGG